MRASSGQVSGMRLKSSKIVVASDCLQNLPKAMNDWRYRRKNCEPPVFFDAETVGVHDTSRLTMLQCAARHMGTAPFTFCVFIHVLEFWHQAGRA